LPQELYDRLNECQPDPSLDTKKAGCESVLIRDGKTGKTLVEPPFPGIRRMQIQKTKQNWSEGLNIRFGKRLVDITTTSSGVTAHFEDGTSEIGSVLIGADGGTSRVRKWLLGPLAAPDVLPYVFMNFSFQVTADNALYLDKQIHPIVDVGVHPRSMYIGLFVLDKPDLAKPETWIFYILATWPKTTAEDEENTGDRLKRLRARMGDDWCEPYKSAVSWVPDDVEIKRDELKIWHGKKWDNKEGRVTLAGDAAHSMTFRK
jgi:2-polyprenyl-6-methoxyphenol hydroxylase-like FAD-dependent oxidoreductase